MKADLHPNYEKVKINCSCGNIFEVGSTLCKDFHIDVCSSCHPYITGKQKLVDSAGRVDKFQKKFASLGKAKNDKK